MSPAIGQRVDRQLREHSIRTPSWLLGTLGCGCGKISQALGDPFAERLPSHELAKLRRVRYGRTIVDVQGIMPEWRASLKLWNRADAHGRGPEVSIWEVGAITQTSYRNLLWLIPFSRPAADCVSSAWTHRASRCDERCEPDGRGCRQRWWDRRFARASARSATGK